MVSKMICHYNVGCLNVKLLRVDGSGGVGGIQFHTHKNAKHTMNWCVERQGETSTIWRVNG